MQTDCTLSLYAPAPSRSAPSLLAHGVLLLSMVIALTAAIHYIQNDSPIMAILILAVPFSLASLVEPFLGVCWLFAIFPLDNYFAVIGDYASTSKLLAIPVALGYILQILSRPEMRVTIPRVVKVFWCFSLWAAMSSAWSDYPADSFFGATAPFFLSLFMVIIVGLTPTWTHLKQLLIFVVAGCVVSAALAFLTGMSTGTGRVSAMSLDPNNYARALMFGLLGAIFLMLKSGKVLSKLLYLGAALFLLMAIAATQSRGAYLALATSLTLGLLVTYRKNPLKVILWLGGVAAVIVLLGLILYRANFFSPEALDRLTAPADRAGASRFGIWAAGWSVAFDRPITGFGFTCFDVASNTGRGAHNVYLSVLVELGLPGLLLWLTALFMYVGHAFRMPTRATAFFVATSIAMTMAMEMTLGDILAKTNWYQLGLCSAIVWIVRNETTQEERSPELAENPAWPQERWQK